MQHSRRRINSSTSVVRDSVIIVRRWSTSNPECSIRADEYPWENCCLRNDRRLQQGHAGTWPELDWADQKTHHRSWLRHARPFWWCSCSIRETHALRNERKNQIPHTCFERARVLDWRPQSIFYRRQSRKINCQTVDIPKSTIGYWWSTSMGTS